ncbi:MAG: ABC transporter ATP-binding protein [Methanomassiliicoccus sp.]|nr:ABC transporter ATP-binding protein [Methanomassiliicoccus sp.]
MSDKVIEAKDLVRIYRSSTGLLRKKKKETLAVNKVSFSVDRGELFGVLGPNGAGKTTTIKMLTTLLTPTKGSATVMGFDVVKDPVEVRKRIGLILGGERGLYYRVTGRQNLKYFADLYGVSLQTRDRRIQEVLDMVGLADKADSKVEDYSRGMKQKLHIAKGIVHDPEVLFMDEPTIGLDPQASRETRKLTQSLIDHGKTILLTTHYMFEADELCRRIAVINNGRIVAMDTPHGLKGFVKDTAVIEVEGFGIDDSVMNKVRGLEGVRTVSATMNESKQVMRVQVCDAGEMLSPVTRVLDCKVLDVRVKEPTLEDAYLWLVEGHA